MSDSLLPEAVLPLLRGRFGREYVFVAECASTQQLLPDDAPEGAVAATDAQTRGRGRLGRTWEAPAGSSVLCSVVLRPHVPAASLAELTPVAGRACAEAIARVATVAAEVKWPNDVLIGGRKVAGILAEAREGRVVLGIGVNVHQTPAELPQRTEFPATSLALETPRPPARARLLAEILAELELGYDAWVASYG